MDTVTNDSTFLLSEARETAWNLYRAFRMNAEVQREMDSARAVMHGNPFAHAHYIANWHNLTCPSMVTALTPEGVRVLVSAIGYEIRNEKPPVSPSPSVLWDSGKDHSYLDNELPIAFQIEPLGIVINPLSYGGKVAFLAHMEQELPRIYNRLTAEVEADCTDQSAALKKAHKQWLNELEKDDTSNAVVVSGEGWRLHINSETRERQRERRTPFQRRDTPLRALPRHAQWWMEHRVQHESKASIARREGVKNAAVVQATKRLEERFRLVGDWL